MQHWPCEGFARCSDDSVGCCTLFPFKAIIAACVSQHTVSVCVVLEPHDVLEEIICWLLIKQPGRETENTRRGRRLMSPSTAVQLTPTLHMAHFSSRRTLVRWLQSIRLISAALTQHSKGAQRAVATAAALPTREKAAGPPMERIANCSQTLARSQKWLRSLKSGLSNFP